MEEASTLDRIERKGNVTPRYWLFLDVCWVLHKVLCGAPNSHC